MKKSRELTNSVGSNHNTPMKNSRASSDSFQNEEYESDEELKEKLVELEGELLSERVKSTRLEKKLQKGSASKSHKKKRVRHNNSRTTMFDDGGGEDDPVSDFNQHREAKIEVIPSSAAKSTAPLDRMPSLEHIFKQKSPDQMKRSNSDELLMALLSDPKLAERLTALEPTYPLHGFVRNGQKDMVELLLSRGLVSTIDQKDSRGDTPLAIAIKREKAEIAGLLLRFGADPGICDANNDAPIHLALMHSVVGIACDLIDLETNNDHLNAQNALGNTPLMLCCKENRAEVAKKLLRRGVRVNLRNNYQENALLCAIDEGMDFSIISEMVACGVDLNWQDRLGNTALHRAVHKDHFDIIEKLIESGSSVSVQNREQKKALDLARSPRVRKLLEDFDPSSKSWKWEIPRAHLSLRNKVGEGNFSDVYKAFLLGTPVAAKVIKVEKITETILQSFKTEVGIMSDIRHPNVVLFIGACTGAELCIITEYLQLGSLRDFIKNAGDTLRWAQALKFAITAARGMNWLHTRRPVVLHRDLHCNNILVSDNQECKISDLGLSEIQVAGKQSKRAFYKRIAPPEIGRGEPFTRASDVYMFGLICLELLAKRKCEVEELIEIDPGRALGTCFAGEVKRDKFVQLIKDCTHDEPTMRPDFTTILNRLDEIFETYNSDVREKIIANRDEQGEYSDGET